MKLVAPHAEKTMGSVSVFKPLLSQLARILFFYHRKHWSLGVYQPCLLGQVTLPQG
jgi:hypothetical protein